MWNAGMKTNNNNNQKIVNTRKDVIEGFTFFYQYLYLINSNFDLKTKQTEDFLVEVQTSDSLQCNQH